MLAYSGSDEDLLADTSSVVRGADDDGVPDAGSDRMHSEGGDTPTHILVSSH